MDGAGLSIQQPHYLAGDRELIAVSGELWIVEQVTDWVAQFEAVPGYSVDYFVDYFVEHFVDLGKIQEAHLRLHEKPNDYSDYFDYPILADHTGD